MKLFGSRHHSLLALAYRRERERQRTGKEIYKDGVNQRASLKQNQLTDVFKQIFGEKVEIKSPALCKKNLWFSGLEYVDNITLSYFSKNSLFTRIFELITQTTLDSINTGAKSTLPLENIEIGIKFLGSLHTEKVVFTVISGGEKAEDLARKLNEVDLIKNRIIYLEALDVRLTYEYTAQKWIIGLATGKGSVVWSLIPPVHMLIRFTKTDAARLVEFFQLTAFEIRKFETALCL